MTAAQVEKATRASRRRILARMSPEARALWRLAHQEALALRNGVAGTVLFLDSLLRPEVWRSTPPADRGRALALVRNGLDLARQAFDRYSPMAPILKVRKPVENSIGTRRDL